MIANDAWLEWHKLGYIKQMPGTREGEAPLYLWSQCATEETLSGNLYICMDHQWYHRKSSPPAHHPTSNGSLYFSHTLLYVIIEENFPTIPNCKYTSIYPCYLLFIYLFTYLSLSIARRVSYEKYSKHSAETRYWNHFGNNRKIHFSYHENIFTNCLYVYTEARWWDLPREMEIWPKNRKAK